ncbi:MAG TPA: DUF1343 domain-containing protein [Kofleriaceae bacterium]|nr:DUF1343 domain-containing protein [Kofleriaceae bacterium]
MARVRTGLERLLDGEGPRLAGRRLGLIANPTTVDPDLVHAVDRLVGAGLGLVALYGPEHGLRGDAQYMEAVGEARDRRTGLPVYSLYGHTEASLSPAPETLAGLDTLLFDIQDVGSRYYTYAATMVLAMRACARAGVEVVVLDRPNPIGGELVEGGAVETGFGSFVGLLSVPNRHGLTVGELARMVREQERLDLELTVVPMDGWRRDMRYADTGLPWVLPSPNMPTEDTALVYPGMCLLEGSEISEGRGTTRPFELAGAPFVDAYALADELAAAELPGARFRPLAFTPTFEKHVGKPCGGVQIHVTDRRAFRPYLTGVAFLRAVRTRWPAEFAWRSRAYEFVDQVPAIDLLCGSAAVREGIDAGASLADLAATWADAERDFRQSRGAWLLYG